MQNEQKGFFESMHPKAGFMFGLASGIAIFSIVGFAFIALGSSSSSTASANGSNAVVAKANPTPIAPPPSGGGSPPPPVTDEDHVRGDSNASLTFIEYSDYECPFCKRFHPTMLQMMDEYKGKVKWVYRHFPLGFHDPLATKEATAAECANDLDGNDSFWAMSDLIFERTNSNGRGLEVSQLSDFAEEIGLNRGKFDECLNSGKFAKHIKDDQAGGSAAGVTGTPGSFLVDADGNATLISGAVPYAQIKAMIDAAL